MTADPDRVATADRVVLPGQGAFADCAAGLAAVPGLHAAVGDSAAAGRPFLGICVGMQLMAQRGLEHRTTPGFGWIAGEIMIEDPGVMRWIGAEVAHRYVYLAGAAGAAVVLILGFALTRGRRPAHGVPE